MHVFDYSVVQIVLTIIAAYLLQRIVKVPLGRVIEHLVKSQQGAGRTEEAQRENTLKTAIYGVLVIVIWLAALLAILVELDVNVAALATGAGAASIIIGLGAQNIIKDWLAGVFIIAENEYRVGDVVDLNVDGMSYFGTIDSISVRLTKMRLLDGGLSIINNGTISVISNHSFRYGNILVDVIVNYDTDLDKVEEIINEVGKELAKDEKWAEYIKSPVHFYRVDSFNESSITVKAIGEVHASGMQWMTAGAFRQYLHRAFKKHGITVPHEDIVVTKPEKSKG
jgi:small conductance mechanosensitive channel